MVSPQPNSGTAWAYVRMSTKDQEDSPITQGQLTTAFMQEHGLTWTRSYFDLGESAGSLKRRPGVLALLNDAERLRPACIVFYRLDRAFRNAEEQAVSLRRLKRHGVRVLKVKDPNLQGPTGDLIDGILGNINEFERQLIGMRIRDHNQAMAERGEWPGGILPFGYCYRQAVKDRRGRKPVTIEPGVVEPDPVEWPVAEQLWQWALAGYRSAQILEMAEAAGMRRRRGGPWTFTTVGILLRSRWYAGYVPFGHSASVAPGERRKVEGGEWYRGQHPAMISLEEWHRVQLGLRQGNQKQRQTHNPCAELVGIIRCSICGGPVASSGVTRDHGYVYTCIAAAQKSASHGIWGRRDWMMHLTVRAVVDAAAEVLPKVPVPADSAKRRESIGREIARLQNQRRRLRDLYRLGEYNDDMESYQRDTRALDAQISAREHELQSVGAGSDELRQRYRQLQGWSLAYEAAAGSVVERQALWRSVVEQIECDGDTALVWLRDLGPSVPRHWRVKLPPRGSRMPGTNNGVGTVGEPKDGRQRGHLGRLKLRPEPVIATESGGGAS